MSANKIEVPIPDGFRIEDINAYDTSDTDDLWELMIMESPWKKDRVYSDAEIEQTIRESVEPNGSTIIAARELETGKVRGTMQIVATTFMDAGKKAEMGYVSTHPDYARRGIYTAVWGRGLQWLSEHEVRVMTWNSNPAIPHRAEARHLYLKFGAEIIAQSPDPTDMEAGTDVYRLDLVRGIKTYRELQLKK